MLFDAGSVMRGAFGLSLDQSNEEVERVFGIGDAMAKQANLGGAALALELDLSLKLLNALDEVVAEAFLAVRGELAPRADLANDRRNDAAKDDQRGGDPSIPKQGTCHFDSRTDATTGRSAITRDSSSCVEVRAEDHRPWSSARQLLKIAPTLPPFVRAVRCLSTRGDCCVKSDSLAGLLKCPNCSAVGMSLKTSEATCPKCDKSLPRDGRNILFDDAAALSDDWKAMQAGSVERYQDETYNEEEAPVLALFGAFIGCGINRDAVVLDIGCGPFPEIPPYVAELDLENFVALEPLTTPAKREYDCLVGAVAENIPLADQSVDVAIFATSLDHIEAEDDAMAEVKRILKPGGRVIIWQGLYEPEYLASTKTFAPIFNKGSLAKRLVRAAAAPLEYAVLFWRMRDRKSRLASGKRIDNAHCRYYTREMMDRSLARWGMTKKREVVVPGSPSMFIDARFA